MQTIQTITEYQYLIDEVLSTKKAIKVKVELSHDKLANVHEELILDGVEIFIGNDYDEIKPVSFKKSN